MATFFSKWVVRPYVPKRRAVWLSVAAFLTILILYSAFELGRYDAGFRVVDSVRGALAASARIRALEADNARLRTELEAADVARRVDREGYKQVERSLGDMQSQIARLNQDLSFYRGLVQPDSLIHVKVQQLQIVPESAQHFRLRFVLVQTGKSEGMLSGTVTFSVSGLQQGKPLDVSLAQISPNHRVSLAYSFRYFEDYDELIELPPGFEPTRVDVEVHSGHDQVHAFRQAFVWKAQGMSVETEARPASAPQGDEDVQAETE